VSQFYAIALDEGQLLEVGGIESGIALSVTGPTGLAGPLGLSGKTSPDAVDVAWTEVAADPDTGVARWIAEESGIHSLRVDAVGAVGDPATTYAISFDVDPGSRPAVTQREAEQALLGRLGPIRCQALDEEQESRTFDGGAIAGVRCRRPARGIFELKLFTFADAAELQAFHAARVDEVRPAVTETARACLQGRSGVRDWDHGRISCWTPQGQSRGVLHWTDERTNTYGIVRTLVDQNAIRLRLWGELMRRIR
jgi:hypothetical protein